MSAPALALEPNDVQPEFMRDNNRDEGPAEAPLARTKQDIQPSSRGMVSFQNGYLRKMLAKKAFGPQPTTAANSDGALVHSFRAHLSAGIARLKFDGFCQDWGARFVRQDQELFTYHIALPVPFYRRLFGSEPVLIVQFRLMHPKNPTEPLTTVNVEIRASGCGPKRARRYLNAVGQEILKSILLNFQMHPDRRLQARIPLDRALKFYPALPAFKPREVADGKGMDISPGGMRFWSPNCLSSSHVGIDVPVSVTSGSLSVLGRVLRVLPGKEGGYEIAVAFPDDQA